MNLSIIAAVANNGVIGKNNKLIWHYPKDMQRFVELTKQAGIVIMGRKTHEAIGKLLPGRINIVISRDKHYQPIRGALTYSDIDQALDFLRYYGKEIMVIGGEQIYREFLPFVNKLYITNINSPYEGDAYFPDVNVLEWQHVNEIYHTADTQHQFPFTFDIYERVKS